MCAVLCEWCVLCAKLFEALGERELLETDLVRAVAVAMAVATAMAMAVAVLLRGQCTVLLLKRGLVFSIGLNT